MKVLKSNRISTNFQNTVIAKKISKLLHIILHKISHVFKPTLNQNEQQCLALLSKESLTKTELEELTDLIQQFAGDKNFNEFFILLSKMRMYPK